MDITISPRKLQGQIPAISSKSHAHRILICAALSKTATEVVCPYINQDIWATVNCLNALGAGISPTDRGFIVNPIGRLPEQAILPCEESGSTLRFMLPVAAALGVDTTFLLKGRLPQRPLSPLWEVLEQHGVTITRPTEDTVQCRGKLQKGIYSIDGSVSSQYITGLMFALAILGGSSSLKITGNMESKPYIALTKYTFSQFGIHSSHIYSGVYPFENPQIIAAEGDWSNAAFFIGGNAMGNQVTVLGLDDNSTQGDKAVLELSHTLTSYTEIDGRDIPDLIPILSVVAAANKGAFFHGIGRLRLKESDRIQAISAMLQALGIESISTEDSLLVKPGKIRGGTVHSFNDHRIAMAAAIAATAAEDKVTILEADCVKKSYPGFWEDYISLGGHYEQYIR